MSKKEIIIESTPFDENGQPILEGVMGVPGKVKEITQDGVREVDGLRVKVKMDQKKIVIKSSNKGKIVDVYEGSKLTLFLSDLPNSQICPPMLCLGQVVLVKDKVYELTYSDIPIEGWTVRDRSDVKNPNAKQKCYPEEIKTQKELMDIILSHESFFTCAFLRTTLEHPPEIQDKIDMESLLVREQAYLERKAKIDAAFLKEKKQLDSQKKKLESKQKEGN